jgi:hypothetical protein
MIPLWSIERLTARNTWSLWATGFTLEDATYICNHTVRFFGVVVCRIMPDAS